MAEAWVVEGRVSDNPHAHPIQPSKGQHIVYVDTVADGQVVAYLSDEAPPRGAWARFSGTALHFETTSPRPGSTKKFPVKQLTVESVERLPASDAVQALVDELGRGEMTAKRKQEARTAIHGAGKDAIPVLIASLDDGRVGGVDWRAWWRTHRGDSLDAIHAATKPLVDEYFKSGGDTQEVP